jgi:hypothetical protein
MLMVVEELFTLVLLRLKISILLGPSLRETSAAQVVRQSKVTASKAPVLLISMAMLVFVDLVPNRVMVVLSVRVG